MNIENIGEITISQDISERDLGDEIIVIKAGSEELHTFKDTGLEIWRLIKKGNTAKGILDGIIEEYEVDREKASKDLGIFLEECKRKGVINY
jgi:hypothetical protein